MEDSKVNALDKKMNVKQSLRQKMKSMGYIELGTYVYNDELSEELRLLLENEENILIIPEKFSKASGYKTKFCQYLEINGRCRYSDDDCYGAHDSYELRHPDDPISSYVLELYSWHESVQKIKIFQKISSFINTNPTINKKMEFDMEAINKILCNTIEQDEEQMREVVKLKTAYENLHIEKTKLQENEAKYKQNMAKSKKSYENQIVQLNDTIERYKNEIKNLKEEQKIELDENLEKDVNYKKLYLSLVESLKQNFDSPINFDKMKSPCILKSGQTIDEVDFDILHQMRSRDPYDRTKAVDIKIPNLALRNIIDTVNKIENCRRNMQSQKFSDAFYQDEDDFVAEKGLQKNIAEQYDINTPLPPKFYASIEEEALTPENLYIFEKLSSLYVLVIKRTEKKESEEMNKEHILKLYEYIIVEYEDLKESVGELRNEDAKSALKLLKYLYSRSCNWSFSFYCLELIKIIAENDKELSKSAVCFDTD